MGESWQDKVLTSGMSDERAWARSLSFGAFPTVPSTGEVGGEVSASP
jgi:hypothetical protein